MPVAPTKGVQIGTGKCRNTQSTGSAKDWTHPKTWSTLSG